ncbi:MAG: PqqD family protein [Chloroflexota bacterium]
MTILGSTRIVRKAGLQTANVDDDLIILNMKTNNYIALDDIGRRIWALIENPVTVDEVCTALKAEFDAASEQISADVIKFLSELQTEDLVHVVDS